VTTQLQLINIIIIILCFFNISNPDILEAFAAVQLRPSHFWYVTWRRLVDSSWKVMAHGDAWEGNWRGELANGGLASTLHTTSEHGLASITTADVKTSAASSRLNWRPRRFKWIRPFRRKTKSGFCACGLYVVSEVSVHSISPICQRSNHPSLTNHQLRLPNITEENSTFFVPWIVIQLCNVNQKRMCSIRLSTW